jgi:hypothetical protein
MLPSSPAYRGASTTISSPDNEAAAFARSGADHGSHQRGNADSAVRWQRNGAGGLKEFVLCGCLPPVFGGFAIRRQLSVLIAVAQKFSCRSRRGEFCEPPQGGASARSAETGLYFNKPEPPEHLFLPPFRVAASCIFQSAAEL